MTITEAMKMEPSEVNQCLSEFEGLSTAYCFACEKVHEEKPKPYTASLDACQSVKERLSVEQLEQFSIKYLPEIVGADLDSWAHREVPKLLKATADQTARALAATVKGDL